MNPKVDEYLLIGCGRCKYVGTPQCKVHKWPNELQLLRQLALDSQLTEDRKWGNPCYTLNGKNVLMIGAFKENAVMSFFKGGMITGYDHLLQKAGENTIQGRVMRFTSVKQIQENKKEIKAIIKIAMELERQGVKPLKAPEQPLPVAEELLEKFRVDPTFEKAFYALTPGRQKAYLIHFNEPKQAKTKEARIEKYYDQIMRGVGLHDEYAKRGKQ